MVDVCWSHTLYNAGRGPDAVVEARTSLVEAAWKVDDHGFEPQSDLQISKKQNVSSQLTREDLILCGASMTET